MKRKILILNYLYLINTELLLHRGFLVNPSYFLNKNGKPLSIKNLLNAFQQSETETLKQITLKHLKDDIWKMLRSDLAGLFTNELMQDLSGYYTVISSADLMTDPRIKNETFIDYISDLL